MILGEFNITSNNSDIDELVSTHKFNVTKCNLGCPSGRVRGKCIDLIYTRGPNIDTEHDKHGTVIVHMKYQTIERLHKRYS